MTEQPTKVDQIVKDLLEKRLPRERRIELLRELVRRGDGVPDELLDVALRKLMERLTE